MAKIEKKNQSINRRIVGISLIFIALCYLYVILFPGKTNTLLYDLIYTVNKLIGLGKYFIFIFLTIEGIHLLFNFNIPNFYNRMFGITSLILILLAFIHLRLIYIENAYFLSLQGIGGGLYGYYVANHLNSYFGLAGAYLFLIALGLVALLFATDLSFLYIVNLISKRIINIFNRLTPFLSIKRIEEGSKQRKKAKQSIKIYSSDDAKTERKSEPIFKKAILSKEGKKVATAVQGKIDFAVKSGGEENSLCYSYVAPTVNLLNEPRQEYKDRNLERIRENIALLQRTLDNFNIQGEVIGATQGPTVTRYEIQPAPGVKVSKITNLSNDIALAFASPSVRIEAPIPGKNAIGIEVPNKEKNTVFLREIIESKDYQANSSFILPILLGKDIGGKNIIADLVELPHLLIAGSTGSGKSVCLNTIILSLIYRLGPEMVRFLMVDPKRVELNIYNGIPHLISPIVTNTKKVDKVLNWAISEMERRFKIFAEVGVRNLKGYHEYIKSTRSEETSLPYIVIIIDELADLMLSAPVKVEEALCRLAQMTRATGIHLVIATQRPSVDIITGSIKVNFPSRIAFAVSTQVDSRTILDVNGAEKLLGNGDMLFSPISASKPIRAQGAFVSEKEIKDIVSFLVKNNTPPDYNGNIIEHLEQKEMESAEMEDEEDELFEEAVETIINNKQASISILQRKLRIGYTRAARLIDLMEKKGLVGPYDGRNPRKILFSAEDFFSNYKDSHS